MSADEKDRSSTHPPIDFTYRYTPGAAPLLYRPEADPTASEGEAEWRRVARKLIEGNLNVVRYIKACQGAMKGEPSRFGSQVIQLSDADVLLEPRGEDGFPIQLPVALVLGCVDARAPAEIVFGTEFLNDVFNVRLAGNVVAEECMGSVQYALRNLVLDDTAGGPELESETPARERNRLRLLVSLGHEGCGAVNAAVHAFQAGRAPKALSTGPVAALLGHLFFPSLILASEVLDGALGANTSRDPKNMVKLSRLTSYLNAAWGAHVLEQHVKAEGAVLSERVGVVYGVFDPRDMHVRAVPFLPSQPALVGSSFGAPPRDLDELRGFARRLARAIVHPESTAATGPLLADRLVAAHLDDIE